MFMSCAYNTGQNRNMDIGNKSFEYVAKFKYLETPLTKENCVHKQFKSKLNSQIVATFHFRFFFLFPYL